MRKIWLVWSTRLVQDFFLSIALSLCVSCWAMLNILILVTRVKEHRIATSGSSKLNLLTCKGPIRQSYRWISEVGPPSILMFLYICMFVVLRHPKRNKLLGLLLTFNLHIFVKYFYGKFPEKLLVLLSCFWTYIPCLASKTLTFSSSTKFVVGGQVFLRIPQHSRS